MKTKVKIGLATAIASFLIFAVTVMVEMVRLADLDAFDFDVFSGDN